jgi:CysZ protein
MSDAPAAPPPRPGVLRRAAAGAWHVPAGFAFLLRAPRLWLLAAPPVVLAAVLMFLGAVLGIYLIPRIETAFAPPAMARPVAVDIFTSLLLWTVVVGSGVFLGLGLALLFAAPLLQRLSRQVEARVAGPAVGAGPTLLGEVAESLRASLYLLAAAPGVILLGLVPLVGPVLAAMWGAGAVALQMTDPALARRGLGLAGRWRWHRQWLAESQGFGLAGMVGLLVPLANLLLAPAMIVGGTLLVIDLEAYRAEPPGPASAPEALASSGGETAGA